MSSAALDSTIGDDQHEHHEAGPGPPRLVFGEQDFLAAPEPREPQDEGPPPLLVAEDDASLRGMLSVLIPRLGYRPTLCADGEEALEALRADTPFHGFLLDLRMPRVTGLDVLAQLRADPRRRDLPVIVMSAFSDNVQASEALRAGADAFLSKPFTTAQLETALTSHVPRR